MAGLPQQAGLRIEAARAIRPFAAIHDSALRAQLTRLELEKLADANVLVSLAGQRRQALWQAVAGAPVKDLLKNLAQSPRRLWPRPAGLRAYGNLVQRRELRLDATT